MKKSELSTFIKEEIINTLSEDSSADKAAHDAKKVAIDKEIVALQKKKQELSKGAQSSLAENNNPELEKKVLTFLKGIAKLYDYSINDAFMAVEGTMKRLKGNLNLGESTLAEGTWALPPTEDHKKRAIKDLEKWKTHYYNIVGDDEVFDGVDSAIRRIEKLPLSKDNLEENQELDELARIATTLKAGDADKIKAAKETYAGNWREKLIDAVVSAGEKGITQPDLAAALNKPSQQAINPTVNDLIKMGVLTKAGADIAKEKPKLKTSKGGPNLGRMKDGNEYDEEGKPKAEKAPKSEPKDEEEDVEIEDTYYKVDDEFDAPEEEPKAKDIAKAEKVLGKATSSHAGKLSPEDEARLEKLKKGINAKVAKLSKMKKSDRLKSDEMKVLKALVGRDDVKKLFKQKGVSLKDLVSDVIAESTKLNESQEYQSFFKDIKSKKQLLKDKIKKDFGFDI